MSNLLPLSHIILTKLLDKLPEVVKEEITIETLKIGAEKSIIKVGNINHFDLISNLEEYLSNESSLIDNDNQELVAHRFMHTTMLPDTLYVSYDNTIEYSFNLDDSGKTIYEKLASAFVLTNHMVKLNDAVQIAKSFDSFSFGIKGDIDEALINIGISFFEDEVDFVSQYEKNGSVDIDVNSIITKFIKTGKDTAYVTVSY